MSLEVIGAPTSPRDLCTVNTIRVDIEDHAIRSRVVLHGKEIVRQFFQFVRRITVVKVHREVVSRSANIAFLVSLVACADAETV